MKKTLAFLCLIIALLTFSCSADDDDDKVQSETPTLITKVNQGIQTYKILYSDTGKLENILNTNDNTLINITYDSQGRLERFNDNTYTYNASNKLESISNDQGTCEFIYNNQELLLAQNIIIKGSDSFFVTDAYIERTYFYDNQDRIVECVETLTFDNFSDVSYAKWELSHDINGRISKAVGYRKGGASSSLILDRTIDFTYDSKKNPMRLFYNLIGVEGTLVNSIILESSLHKAFSQLDYEKFLFFPIEYINSNNVFSTSTTFHPTFRNGEVRFVYKETNNLLYNDNDYPISGERVITENGKVTDIIALSWEYTTN